MAYSVETDEKWQKKWADTHLYRFDKTKLDKKLYALDMFSYPSGANLHLGHWYQYGVSDSWARFKLMQGYNVLHPQGFDAFGLPAENYAIKTGIHPKDSTYNNIATMTEQLKKMGTCVDWDYALNTCDESYYKWTQWLFLKLYEKGLAYRKNAPVNWCPSCQTVLANEQVKDGRCDRCDSVVERKKMNQWFFKITAYGDKLLEKIDDLDWPEKTKKIQKNWIGKSAGALVSFDTSAGVALQAFTTRADTLYGLSYCVIAPEHESVGRLTTPEQKAAVDAYVAQTAKLAELDRLSDERERTGVFTGSYAVNPVDGRRVPIWVADYVIATYGTGFVMAVPAHDARDFDFATKYDLPVVRVIQDRDGKDQPLPFCDHGRLADSAEFTGLTTEEAIPAIVAKLAKAGKGDLTTMFRLRDWLISRQRYWGAPIPIIHCPKCGEVMVPESDLPVKLPYDVEFKPTGESPLARCEAFMAVKCPKCGGPARSDPDTMDTFVDSSWYFLRYPDNRNDQAAFDSALINRVLPVDKYVGGQEHATMHLLYARFFTKVLCDLGYVAFDEPFKSLVHQGMVLGADGQKMSKSKGNTIIADPYIQKYGSDVLRLYLEFGFSYTDGGPWSEKGIESMDKFVRRIEALFDKAAAIADGNTAVGAAEKELDYIRNHTIKSVARDIEVFQFNTALARMMEYLNALAKYVADGAVNKAFLTECLKTYALLLAPFAPHFAEELWEKLGQAYSVFNHPYPVADERALQRDIVNMVVQVNGKLRGQISVAADAAQEAVVDAALALDTVRKFTDGHKVVKTIVIPKKLVNIVVA
ncbi:MAG: leucine--tRNA ligase [Alphaproteobacteria bacterium]|nr:leucine--tRNA ligase [Alphaproteobacteria bacterium]